MVCFHLFSHRFLVDRAAGWPHNWWFNKLKKLHPARAQFSTATGTCFPDLQPRRRAPRTAFSFHPSSCLCPPWISGCHLGRLTFKELMHFRPWPHGLGFWEWVCSELSILQGNINSSEVWCSMEGSGALIKSQPMPHPRVHIQLKDKLMMAIQWGGLYAMGPSVQNWTLPALPKGSPMLWVIDRGRDQIGC